MSDGCRYRSVVPSWIASCETSCAPVLKTIIIPAARRRAVVACSREVISSDGKANWGRGVGGEEGQVQGRVVVRERVIGGHCEVEILVFNSVGEGNAVIVIVACSIFSSRFMTCVAVLARGCVRYSGIEVGRIRFLKM